MNNSPPSPSLPLGSRAVLETKPTSRDRKFVTTVLIGILISSDNLTFFWLSHFPRIVKNFTNSIFNEYSVATGARHCSRY